MKQILLLIYILLCSFSFTELHAQTDSLNQINLQKRILNSKVYQITHVGAPLIIIGASISQQDRRFRDMRNSYIPSFRYHYDDYMQYAPGVIMFGMKAFGVEGRSSWGRMLVSDIFATSLMALAINSTKYAVAKERPDRSSKNSFPSGHTATAFMLATMLHKEYGTTRSPLYSILGYSLATGTAISRQLNNRHWFSDVLAGAGIGIISTELGYFLADLIFKEKGLIRPIQSWNPSIESGQFSYLGLQMGYSIGKREVHLPQGIEIEGTRGASSSLVGGWFFNSHWGISGKFTVSQVSPQINSAYFFKYHPEAEPIIKSFQAHSVSYSNVVVGVQYNTRVFPGIYVGGNLMAGVGWTGSYEADVIYQYSETAFPLIRSKAYPIPNLDLTAYLMHVTGRNLGLKFFINYNTGRSRASYAYYPPLPNQTVVPITGSNRIPLHYLNFGVELSALFWR